MLSRHNDRNNVYIPNGNIMILLENFSVTTNSRVLVNTNKGTGYVFFDKFDINGDHVTVIT
jgi:hypothetical protein